MSLGYDICEPERSFEQKGITGKVQRYAITDMAYPCYIVCSEPENPVGMHQLKVLYNMFKTIKVSDESTDSSIHIYYSQGEKVAKIGLISARQVKAFLTLFESNKVVCYTDKVTELEGMYLYTLSE